VNLTAYETFFEERRPFFIEGSNIYNFKVSGPRVGGPSSRDNLFYSRRIGRAPRYDPDLEENEYADINDFTRILGAVKLSGKTRNGWSIGIMESLTNEEKYEIVFTVFAPGCLRSGDDCLRNRRSRRSGWRCWPRRTCWSCWTCR
jgi:hypothetical protein